MSLSVDWKHRHHWIGALRVSIGPTPRPWFAVWNCPLHRVHAVWRVPFGRYR